MKTVTYSNFYHNFNDYMQQVITHSDRLTIITKEPNNSAVIMKKTDYDAMQETIQNFSNPQLMKRSHDGEKPLAQDSSPSTDQLK